MVSHVIKHGEQLQLVLLDAGDLLRIEIWPRSITQANLSEHSAYPRCPWSLLLVFKVFIHVCHGEGEDESEALLQLPLQEPRQEAKAGQLACVQDGALR